MVEKGKYEFYDEDWKNISKSAKDLITQLLNRDFKKRISAKQALEHKWIETMC